MEHLTDEELAEEVRQGRQDAYRMLVKRHQTYVYTLILRMVEHPETAEDLSQEVFLKLYRTLVQYRGESKFTTWLYRLTVNLVQDYRRSQRRKPLEAMLDKVRNWFGDRSAEPEQQVVRQEEQSDMQALLASLPDKYRIIMYLYHYKQLSYQEIADIMQLPLKTVETRLYRGKTMLKQKWIEVNGNESEAPERARASAVRKP
ncbi:RNA polymerase sigma factor [Paenibacillus contaminans]|jgi:RNA polymerase sigma-70 factor (ECF subfamily)|uniref:RNA polymerase sigma factor n=1 Tax=Paenibacillus contaminans TaxID=450362 RepID=A0A329MG37_9BACL|nr:sigma-70 family RNA polymerase sigma factor [Paenibacillus contaminans]RAV17653.1 RNA polymerase sigma factor [Paenibacillus contaminans]